MGAWRNRRDGLSFVSRRDCLGVCVTTLAVGAPVQPLHVFAWIVDSGLQDSLKALAHALLRRVDRGSWRWPKRHGAPGGVTVADLADGAGLSRRHAARCLRVLEDQGLVRTTFRPFEVSEYQLVVHGWQQRAEAHRAARKQAARDPRRPHRRLQCPAQRRAPVPSRGRGARPFSGPPPGCVRPPAAGTVPSWARRHAQRVQAPRRPSSTSSEEPRPRFLATSTPAARAVSPDRSCGCGTAGDGRHLLCSRPSSPGRALGPRGRAPRSPRAPWTGWSHPVQTALAMPGRSATPTDLSSACSSRGHDAAQQPAPLPPPWNPTHPRARRSPAWRPGVGAQGSACVPSGIGPRTESLVDAWREALSRLRGSGSMIGAPSTSSCLRCGRWAFEMGWWCWRLRARTLPGGLDATSQTSLPSCRGAWALRWAWSSTSRRPRAQSFWPGEVLQPRSSSDGRGSSVWKRRPGPPWADPTTGNWSARGGRSGQHTGSAPQRCMGVPDPVQSCRGRRLRRLGEPG